MARAILLGGERVTLYFRDEQREEIGGRFLAMDRHGIAILHSTLSGQPRRFYPWGAIDRIEYEKET